MTRTLVTLAALLVAVAPCGAKEFSHPKTVLAGVWQIPFFYTPPEIPSGPVELRAVLHGDTVRVPFERLPEFGLGPRYAVSLEEPMLTDAPGSAIRVDLMVGGTSIRSATIAVESHPSASRLLSVEEDGSVVLWAEDGAGGLLPLDTAVTSSPVREALLLRAA
ncbi:MAG: hypothetical protein EHM19_13500, partial [Candidatus Latescibacterota bacterium]